MKLGSLLTIAKYLPAVLCGLLVVAWVVSAFVTLTTVLPYQGEVKFRCHFGSLVLLHFPEGPETLDFNTSWHNYQEMGINGVLGKLRCIYANGQFRAAMCPIPFLLTLLLPFAIGPFIRFRFPLWSWFAFTALVAVELAYYLR